MTGGRSITRCDALVAELCDTLRRIADQMERIGDMRPHKDGQFVAEARTVLAKARGER